MAVICGDIHGFPEKVRAFLDYKPEELHIALGDYLDSFIEPQSRQIEALQLLLNSDAILLWGNHDLHYLLTPPFVCTGFQYYKEKPLQGIIEANKLRFMAAYAVDGWLCTHAGVHESFLRRVKGADLGLLAQKLNDAMSRMIKKMNTNHSLFSVGKGRGGLGPSGGIFWFDFLRESGLADIKQIFGHTEIKEPVITESYIAIDTTNSMSACWLYDTSANELLSLPISRNCDYSLLPFPNGGLW